MGQLSPEINTQDLRDRVRHQPRSESRENFLQNMLATLRWYTGGILTQCQRKADQRQL
jgi:hypothetical protein